jgi:ABC-2 type transport system ATP-binding protein
VLAGVLAWQGAGHEWTAMCRGWPGELEAAVATSGARIVADRVPSLDEIFVAQVSTSKNSAIKEG